MPCRLVSGLCLAAVCAACGQTGPLYLPESAPPPSQQIPATADDHRPAPSPQTPDEDEDEQ